VPVDAPLGRYRFLVTANRYSLASGSFLVARSGALTLHELSSAPGRVAVELFYPRPLLASELDADLTDRPVNASGGSVTFRIGRRIVVVRRSGGTVFSVRAPAGRVVTVLAARDRFGNAAGVPLALAR
jgi:hypothetical protein